MRMAKRLTQKARDLQEVSGLLTRAILLLDRNHCAEQVDELLGFKRDLTKAQMSTLRPSPPLTIPEAQR